MRPRIPPTEMESGGGAYCRAAPADAAIASPKDLLPTKALRRYESIAFMLSTFAVAAFLVVGCSSSAPIDQTATPAVAPTASVQFSTATPEPTVESTPIPQPTAQAPIATPLPAPGTTRIWDIDQMEQVYVPAGEFIMGTDDEEAKKTVAGGVAYPENPQHTVYLDAFWIDKYEVTNGQYALCVAAGACRAPHYYASETRTYYYGEPEYDNYPVLWVNWRDARAYCEWAGRRLLTEAEWEKAARGTDGRKYTWGNEPVTGERANFCDKNCPRTFAASRMDDGYADTAPVGSYPAGASPYGAMDMAGNVWEWTGTLIKFYPYDATDGREDPSVDGQRVWRGGPWSNGVWWMRVTIRYKSVMNYRFWVLGFRCASSQ